MSWKGRIIGSIIGLFFGGFGAIIGFILGYLLVDKPKNEMMKQFSDARRSIMGQGSNNEHRIIIQTTFRLMGYVARGAGRVNESHIKHAEELMDAMNLNVEKRQLAIDAFNFGKDENFNFQEEAHELQQFTSHNRAILSYIIEILVGGAIADGNLDQGEHERLLNIALAVGIRPDVMERLIRTRFAEYQFSRFAQSFRQNSGANYGYGNQSYENYERYGYDEQEQQQNTYTQQASADELAQAYEILGVTPDTPFDQIRRAHKKLMLKYHPDRLAQQGLPPEMASVYNKKAQSIQAAYNLIKSVHEGK